MSDNLKIWMVTQPAAPFPYTMRTTQVMQHSGGIAWTADLLRHGHRVGIIEQDGRGGCDRVIISSPEARQQWRDEVDAAFDGDEEEATFHLLCREEDAR